MMKVPNQGIFNSNTAWSNLYYKWRAKDTIIKELSLILDKYNIRYEIWERDPKNIILLFGDTKFISDNNTSYHFFLGYDSANILHIGSLIPLLVLNIVKNYYDMTIVGTIISINDIEAISSRHVSIRRSMDNTKKIFAIFKNLQKKYPHLLPFPKYVIRSRRKRILLDIASTLNNINVDDLIKKIYGTLPLNHILSILVMSCELAFWNRKYNIVTAYGVEEFQHLLFYYMLKNNLDIKEKFIGIIFLPIRGKIPYLKMSKSIPDTAIYLTKKEIVKLREYPHIVKEFSQVCQLLSIQNIFNFLESISL